MAKNERTTVIGRVLDDEYVHEHAGAAAAALRDTYRRARRLPPEVAVQDQTLYEHVRIAAAGLTEAVRRAAGKDLPEPPRRRRRPLLLVVAAAGAIVALAAKRERKLRARSGETTRSNGSTPATPAAEPELRVTGT